MNNTEPTEIYHLVPQSEWGAQVGNDNCYVPARFAADGFIHCTGEPATLLAVAEDYFGDIEEPILILRIAVEGVQAPVKFEPPSPIADSGSTHLQDGLLFPHIYGPLNLDAVTGIGVLRRENGRFQWPTHFTDVDTVK